MTEQPPILRFYHTVWTERPFDFDVVPIVNLLLAICPPNLVLYYLSFSCDCRDFNMISFLIHKLQSTHR